MDFNVNLLFFISLAVIAFIFISLFCLARFLHYWLKIRGLPQTMPTESVQAVVVTGSSYAHGVATHHRLPKNRLARIGKTKQSKKGSLK
ncbi:hypothetical protein MIS33_10805 [Wielerella bovis]|uniref:hypothetical protein n=1 Tax=Wielerella bovis TaxID=2917790 RepID=UPI0020195DD9|nr:hypothetical protein [Wielerella bovis]ULJ64601.1 hypothetical protein MIS33_10805 [Wielerella bovis]